MEKRRQQRTKRRLTCQVLVGSHSYPGTVVDASPAGLFVQTRAKPRPNTVVELIFRAQDPHPEIHAEAGVARQREVPSRLRSLVPNAIGLELLDPPPSMLDLLATTLGREPTPPPRAPKVEGPSDRAVRTFRIRLRERDRPTVKVLTIRSESARSARARALARAGRGWKIADVREI